MGAGLPRGLGRRDCEAARIPVRAPALAALAEDEVRSIAGARRRRVHRSAGRPCRPGRVARRLLRGGRPGVRGEDWHRLRYEAAAGTARAARQTRDSEAAVHQGDGAAAPARALGASGDRGAGGIHRMDRTRQAASSAADRGAHRQGRARGRQGIGVITHPEKVLFPEDGITKGELASYYEMIAPLMVPHMRARPVSMERYPAGIGKKGFFHKDVSKGFPDWLERVEVPKKGGTVHHPIVTDTRSLLWLANQNCITPHVWTSRVPDLYSPDICVFDLDPSEDNPLQLTAATFQLRDLLAELSLPSWLKTSG